MAHILGVKKKLAEFEADLLEREAAVDTRREDLLKLRRRVRETIEKKAPDADAAAADRLYDEVRAALRPAREALAGASSALVSADPAVPVLGPDRLVDLPADVDRRAVDEERAAVAKAATLLAEREQQWLRERAAALDAEVIALNTDRLALLGVVSAAKRRAITGFGSAGVDQAAAEVRQVAVILRYHSTSILRWLADLRGPGGDRGASARTAGWQTIKWAVPIFAFWWWRRRAPGVLERLREALSEDVPPGRMAAPASPFPLRLLTFVERVRSPAEWLLFLWALVWLLPTATANLLEVDLVTTVFNWVLGGSVVVQVVDFVAGVETERRARRSKLQTAHLRLRSLQLASRVVVTFGLVLALTRQLVGRGTIHGWVWSLCWFAAIPVVLVLVSWWRATIFERLESKRKKNAVERWVTGNPEGWVSFPAAIVGGAVLLGRGIYDFAKAWLSTFTITRRVLAYLFSREINRKAEEEGHREFGPIPAEAFARLGPESASAKLVPSAADDGIAEVIRRIAEPGGGVFAIVGERGGGKTRLLRQIAESAEDVHVVRCPFGGMEAFAPAFVRAFGEPADATLEAVSAKFDSLGRESAVLVDDAHRLILPMMGGLRAFDRVLALARDHSRHTAWAFAFDDVVWRFLERMRGARPLFDEVIRVAPWGDDAVARLLKERTAEAGIDPDFSALLPELPPDADEIDVEEAYARTEASYYRLIWDYASGNPGAALHAWRTALGVAPDGSVQVKVFQPPKTAQLEQLPDPAVFVLRALVQLEHASREDLCAASGVTMHQVGDALRFGLVHGWVERAPGGEFRVAWTWFRAVTRFLQRRHLLFAM